MRLIVLFKIPTCRHRQNKIWPPVVFRYGQCHPFANKARQRKAFLLNACRRTPIRVSPRRRRTL